MLMLLASWLDGSLSVTQSYSTTKAVILNCTSEVTYIPIFPLPPLSSSHDSSWQSVIGLSLFSLTKKRLLRLLWCFCVPPCCLEATSPRPLGLFLSASLHQKAKLTLFRKVIFSEMYILFRICLISLLYPNHLRGALLPPNDLVLAKNHAYTLQ